MLLVPRCLPCLQASLPRDRAFAFRANTSLAPTRFSAPGRATNQTCNGAGESYPSLWEVPVWVLEQGGSQYSMDYADDGAVDLYDLLKASFDASYAGNRAPLPIFVHSVTAWYDGPDGRAAAVARFLGERSTSLHGSGSGGGRGGDEWLCECGQAACSLQLGLQCS